MATNPISLDKDLYKYLVSHNDDEDQILQELRFETDTINVGHMQSFPEVASFLSFLCKMINPKSILELGTFTGLSSLVMARSIASDARIDTIDMSHKWTRIAKKYWERAKIDHKINLIVSSALPALHTLQENKKRYDFIFLDADKKHYNEYYEICLELLSEEGLLVIDNIFFSGSVINEEIQNKQTISVRELNKTIKHDLRVDHSIIPIGDGITLVRKR